MRRTFRYFVLLLITLLFARCTSSNSDSVTPTDYSPITQELVTIIENDSQLKSLLQKAIDKGKEINPDKVTNPAQTIEEYYDFIQWAGTAMPWTVIRQPEGTSLYSRIDQALNYLCFINDIPLDELEGKGMYNNSLQYTEPYRTWLINFCKAWGEYLSTPGTWNDEYYRIALSDPSFGLQEGWYENPSNWKSFNDFFARNLKSPDARPIAEPNNNNVVASPADSRPEGIWQIDSNSDMVQKEGVVIKSKVFNSVSQMVGPNSSYRDAFANGILTHSFLDVNDYHRYHFPMSGTIKELNIIPGDDASGGVVIWSSETGKYLFSCELPGWQTIETRGCVILETEECGLVALLPIGMSQVGSVNFEPDLKVGDKVQKGDKLGYFLFGGSDFVILFQQGVKFRLTAPVNAQGGWNHLLMGEELGRIGM